jgi:hypothetical protein
LKHDLAESNDLPTTGGLNPAAPSPGYEDLRAERDRLLEENARLREECEMFRRAARHWAMRKFAEDEKLLSDEELVRIVQTTEGTSLDDVIEELERSVRGN